MSAELSQERQKQVPRGFTNLDNAILGLDKRVEGFCKMLDPIMTPPKPIDVINSAELTKAEQLAPVAMNLKDAEYRIRTIENTLGDLMGRMEI